MIVIIGIISYTLFESEESLISYKIIDIPKGGVDY